jgi:hypothetical protein
MVSSTGSAFEALKYFAMTEEDGGAVANLSNIASPEALLKLLAQQRGYYDPTSTEPPKDFETILVKAPERFVSTGKRHGQSDRKIYRELATGYLYYVDNLHYGASAHLEVFTAAGEHLGTANIETGELDASKRRSGRWLHV